MSHYNKLNSANTNQPSALEPYNLFTTDPVLKNALYVEGVGDEIEDLGIFGAKVGSVETYEWGHQSNRHSPKLVTHDRFGRRVDEVHYHPSYHSPVSYTHLTLPTILRV